MKRRPTVLVSIDTKHMILSRYVNKICTHAFQFQHQPSIEEINRVRENPDSFGAPEAA